MQLCIGIVATDVLGTVILFTQLDNILGATNTDRCKPGLNLVVGIRTCADGTGYFSQAPTNEI